MRTVIFIAGFMIHDGLESIAESNGKKQTDDKTVIPFLATVFLAAVVMDIVDFLNMN